MPKIFLSPSTQEYNQYVTGAGSEEYFMNLLADAMEPLLLANGIQYSRNDPQGTAADAMTSTSLFTPTPPARAARDRTGGSSPFIIPAAQTAGGRRSCLRRLCGRSIPCPTR